MKSIKTKIIVTVILCSLVSTFICGAISIVNSVSTSYEDSQQEMQLKCVSQSDELDTMMQNVSQSVEMVYSIAVAKLEHAASFRTSKDYVDTYTMHRTQREHSRRISVIILNLRNQQADFF